MSMIRFGAALLMLSGLLACSSQPTRKMSVPAAASAPAPAAWSFEGRLAVANGKDSGSGRIRWQQDGERFVITLRAPISGQSWKLSGDSHHAQLEGVKPYPVRGTTARELLRRELGWELPVGEMQSWLFGDGFSARAKIKRGPVGELTEVDDSGWNIGYRSWQRIGSVAVPGRIVAKKTPFQVRLAIQRWTLGAGGVGGAGH